MKKLLVGLLSLAIVVVVIPLFSAFEAHVINVSATIENALFVHPEDLTFGTVFPQEYFESSFFITFSQSFSASGQRHASTTEYVIKQKPKPRPEFIAVTSSPEVARDWCHLNSPADANDPDDPYYDNCFPNLCPYLSKTPDGQPSTGPNANNDSGLLAFHDPDTDFAYGKLVKFNQFGSTVGNDPGDNWTVDLPVPCFTGQCAQDWDSFVKKHNPAADPDDFMLPAGLEHEVFGCDLWVEVTDIY
ncbi:MAG: hypothetical protein HYT47_02610 [Candidatus Vogelbacteria bacterium]|nr:hypothetical protein [Candidatus Vogelbacteria bacterium]